MRPHEVTELLDEYAAELRSALDWYDAVGPEQAKTEVAIEFAALGWRHALDDKGCLGSA